MREYDAQHETQLLATLQAYVDSGGHHATIAAQCHVHPSTVKYRLRRIEELTSRKLDDVSVRFELALALRLLSLFTISGSTYSRTSSPRRPPIPRAIGM